MYSEGYDLSKFYLKSIREKFFFRFHLGTAALGSMILTIFQKMKYIIEMNRKILTGRYNSKNFLFDRCYDILRMMEYILKYINDYAYVISGVHGATFFISAKHAFNLIMRSFSITVMSMWVSRDFMVFNLKISNFSLSMVLSVGNIHHILLRAHNGLFDDIRVVFLNFVRRGSERQRGCCGRCSHNGSHNIGVDFFDSQNGDRHYFSHGPRGPGTKRRKLVEALLHVR